MNLNNQILEIYESKSPSHSDLLPVIQRQRIVINSHLMKHGFETSVLTGVVRSIEPSGTIVYTKDGKLHREDGPAIEYSDGGKAWYMNGKLHRDNGPAVEYANGEKSWYYRGQRFG